MKHYLPVAAMIHFVGKKDVLRAECKHLIWENAV